MSRKKVQKNPKANPKYKVHSRKAAAGSASTSGFFRMDKKNWIAVLSVLVITWIVYSGSLNNEFVNWDDEVNIMENKNLQGEVTSQTFKDIFSFDPKKSSVIGNYNPLPIATFALERKFYGIKGVTMDDYNPHARKFHMVNLLLHIGCVLLVFQFAKVLGVGLWGSVVIALLFGIHPMRVESVAWVTERKDVLFGLFYFAALIHYVHFLKTDRKIYHSIFILIYFLLSLFSKIQAVSLPLSMLALDYYFNRPIQFRLIAEKLHYFALSLFFGILGVWFLRESASLDQSKTAYNLFQRLFIGSYSYLTYLYKLVVPYPMSPLYPYPKYLPWYIYASMIPVLGLIGFTAYAWKRGWKEFVFGMLFFTFNIMFLLQIVGAGQGFLADRFTYVAYFGLFFIIGYYSQKHLFESEKWRTPAFGAFGLLFLVHAIMSIQQIKIWENGGTLWTKVLQHYKNVTLPYGNRANFYRERGLTELALADYSEAIRLEPTKAATYNSRGKLYFNQARWDLAEPDYDKAIELDPTKGEYWINRAAVKASTGRFQEALVDVNKGLEVDSMVANGYRTRFLIYQSLNMFGESIPDIDKLLTFTPYDYNLYYEKARALRVINKTAEAIPYYDKAIQGKPNEGLFYLERGKAHIVLGNKAQARADLDMAKRLGMEVDPTLYRNVE